MFSLLSNVAPVKNMKELSEVSRIEKFYNRFNYIYLYGAGKVGKRCLQLMRRINCEPNGFIVSQKEGCKEEIEDIPIIGIEQLDVTDEVGIIVTVGDCYKEEIEKMIKSKGIKNYLFFA